MIGYVIPTSAMVLPAKIARVELDKKNPESLRNLAEQATLKHAAAYNPKDLITYYSYLTGVPGFKNIYKKTLDAATASHAKEILNKNLLSIGILEDALLEPFAAQLGSENKTISDLKSIKIACNTLIRTIKAWSQIQEFNKCSLINVLRATEKLIPINDSHFFSKIDDTLYEFQKLDSAFVRTGKRKCNDAVFENSNLLIKNKANHLIHFSKHQHRFIGSKSYHQDLGLVGENGYFALVDEGKALVTANKQTLKMYQQNEDQPATYVLTNTFDFDTKLKINKLLVRKNVIIVATNSKLWIFRLKDGVLSLEHESGDNSVIEGKINISETGNLFTHSHSYYSGHKVMHRTIAYRHEDGQWHEHELKAFSMHQIEPFAIKAITIQSDNVLIGYVETLNKIVPICFSWINKFWLNEGPLTDFDFVTTQGHERLVALNQNDAPLLISRRLPFHWTQTQISDDKIREYNISEDGNRIIGITDDRRVIFLEFKENAWNRAYSTEIINVNDYTNIPVIPEKDKNALEMRETAEAMLKLDPECLFESINSMIFLKSNDTLYIFQHNRNTNELDLIYKHVGDNTIDLSVLKEAFSSGVILEDCMFDNITRIILNQLEQYRDEAKKALQ